MSENNILSELEFSSKNPVKKLLANSKKFNIYRITLEAGLNIEPHTEPQAVFFFVLEGRGIFTNGKDEMELKANEFIFIKENGIRGIKCIENLVMLAAHA